jgi:glycosyltransferase involved in cell wall biosynthesis
MVEPLSETGLSIVVPAYDEAERLPQTIERIAAYVESKPFTAEVLIVDDGSRDHTAEVVREASRRWPDVTLIQNPGNQGKGYSVRNGMRHASGRIALFTDADLSTPIEEADLLLEAIEAGNDIAIGSRGLRPELIGIHQSLFRETAGKIFNLVVRSVTGLPFKDTQCGFKAFRREAARAIFSRQQTVGFGFDVEVLYLAKKLGFRTTEIPVRWSHNEGTKISMFGDSIRMFTDVLRVRWMDLQGKYKN